MVSAKQWISKTIARLAATFIHENGDGYSRVGIDFDGVILSHNGKVYDKECEGAPDPGMVLYLSWLRKNGYEIMIHTSRCLFPGGYKKVKQFMNKWSLPYDVITSLKLPCILYWDDGARHYLSHNESESFMEYFVTNTREAKESCEARKKKQYGI